MDKFKLFIVALLVGPLVSINSVYAASSVEGGSGDQANVVPPIEIVPPVIQCTPKVTKRNCRKARTVKRSIEKQAPGLKTRLDAKKTKYDAAVQAQDSNAMCLLEWQIAELQAVYDAGQAVLGSAKSLLSLCDSAK